ncbi:tyrosine-type recombinase/integrase [Leekyejoonella antrihumi]|nr:tyrosine-type recombinase/integrase [Leekyejoonella antrihumi]
MSFDQLLDQYVADLIGRGRRSTTVRGYRTDLRRLGQSLKGRRPTADALTRYLASLEELTPATRARHIAALPSFLRWYDARTPGQVGLLRLADDVPAYGGDGGAAGDPHRECDADAARRCIPRQADRDQLYFGLIRHLGLRPAEALNLRMEDLDQAARHLDVPGWGGVRRQVYVDDLDVHLRLLNWREAQSARPGALFAGKDPQRPVSYQAMAKRWGRYVRESGVVSHVSDLRRSHLAELTAGGVPVWVIGQRLGLRNVRTTSGHFLAQDSDEVLDAWRAARSAAEATQPPTQRKSGS